jgi:hypothetical protein
MNMNRLYSAVTTTFTCLCLAGVVALPSWAEETAKAPAEAADTDLRVRQVFVDLKTGLVTPATTIVNLQGGDTLALKIDGPDNAAEADVVTQVSVGTASASVTGTHVTIAFRKCSGASARRLANAAHEKDVFPESRRQNKARSFSGRDLCPNTILVDHDLVEVLSETAKDRDVASVSISSRSGKTAGLVIRMVSRRWSKSFSGGVGAVVLPRDERYTLSPSTADATKGVPTRLSKDGDFPYTLATFAHYDFIGKPFAASLGLSTSVPADELNILFGPSYKLRSLPLVDSGYLTAGVALTSRQRLKAKYEQGGLAPIATELADLTEKRRGWAFFVAFSFGFSGDQETFTGKLK